MPAQLPSVAAGSRLRASVVQAWIDEINNINGDRTMVIKGSNSTRSTANTGSTLTADPHLTAPVLASTTYKFDIMVYHRSPTAADIKFSLDFPAGSSITWGAVRMVTSATLTGDFDAGVYIAPTAQVSAISAGGTATDQMTLIQGTIVVGATPGNLTLWWAQDTANASDTTLWARSSLELRRQR